MGRHMASLSWLRRRHERKERRAAEASTPLRYFFGDAYGEAHRRRREAERDAEARAQSAPPADETPRKKSKGRGLDTATRMAMDADFSRPREPAEATQSESSLARGQIEELRRILRDR